MSESLELAYDMTLATLWFPLMVVSIRMAIVSPTMTLVSHQLALAIVLSGLTLAFEWHSPPKVVFVLVVLAFTVASYRRQREIERRREANRRRGR